MTTSEKVNNVIFEGTVLEYHPLDKTPSYIVRAQEVGPKHSDVSKDIVKGAFYKPPINNQS